MLQSIVTKKCVIMGLVFLCTSGFLGAKKILLTGGAGFIGSHVAQKLLNRGDTVIIVDNFNDAYDIKLKKNNIQHVLKNNLGDSCYVHEVDIRDCSALENIFIESMPDVICHLAARAGIRGSIDMPAEYVTSNILGTLNIFELAKKYHIGHVVYASSSSVYGNCTQAPFLESFDISHPVSPYAMTKGACELLAYTYFHVHSIASTSLRFFTVYGPRGRVDMAPFKFLDAIYKGETLHVYGDGSAIRDFTSIDDIADGIVQALDNPCGCEVLNLGRGEPIVLRDFIEIIEKVVGKKAHIRYESKRQADVDMTHADVTKAQRLIGYNPTMSVYEGMKKMYEWYVGEYLLLMEQV